MLKRLLNFNILGLLLASFLGFSSIGHAEDSLLDDGFYPDKTKMVTQQIDLLKNRLAQSRLELESLQKQQASGTLSGVHFTKAMVDETGLEIAIAQSNLDSINIELTESQQAIGRLEKDIQEIQNQLNVFNIFGLKVVRDGSPDLKHLRQELDSQDELLALEKNRLGYLEKLQSSADTILQLYKTKYTRVESVLKSQTILLLKEQQAKTEFDFEQQQSMWLQRLNNLKSRLDHFKTTAAFDTAAYYKLQNEIFYANENVNLTYLKMLIARYQDQIQQLKISIARGSSITLFNKVTEQAQLLGKQLARLNILLKGRVDILVKHNKYFSQPETVSQSFQGEFTHLNDQYQTAIEEVASLNQTLIKFRTNLDQTLQQELSSRQGLPGFGTKAWLDLGGELLLIPSLAFQVFKSLSHITARAILDVSAWGWAFLIVLEAIWVALFLFINHFLKRIVARMRDHEFGHINLKWLFIKLIHRNLLDIAIFGNLFWLFSFLGVPAQNFTILINLALVWLFFKALIQIARLGLVESVHDRAGRDVHLYHQLKWIFLTGGIVTALTVFMHQLPVIYEVKDLFDRVFLVFLLIASVLLLKQWHLFPGLIMPYIDSSRTYLKRVILLLSLLIPLILLVNSIVGLFGFVNLILTIAWYESVFLLVLVGYLLLRGLLNDAMEWVSKILIRHVTNGWLWTEAFLKPIDRLMQIMLFLLSWAILFLLYGWDRQSPVVERLNKLLHYPLADILSTIITPLSVIELIVVISLLYWAARWTREFVYRMLLSRTKDLGLRNSLAILSQYAMILIGVFISLRLLGIDFRALTFVATAFAFGVGLGLRDLVNNFACGFLLLLERPLRVGDTISLNGCEGEVTHIGGRAVTVRTWDHMDVIIPNAEIFSKSFTNWTAKDNVIRTSLTIKINRHDSPHDIQAIIYEVLEQNKEVLKDPPPEVFMTELADGLIELEVRYHLNFRQVKSRIGLRSEVLLGIWSAFEKHGVQPPYPHREVHLKV